MITVSAEYRPARIAPTPGARSVIVQPNQSASWETNKQILLGLGALCGVIVTGFSLVGAWVALPFAGLEITALGGALYVVCKKLNTRHILYFSDDRIIIEKGIRQPQRVWQLPRRNTFISVERQRHPWDPIGITVCCHRQGHNDNISIGEFLNREDSDRLLTVLRQQGLPVRNDSPLVSTTL